MMLRKCDFIPLFYKVLVKNWRGYGEDKASGNIPCWRGYGEDMAFLYNSLVPFVNSNLYKIRLFYPIRTTNYDPME